MQNYTAVHVISRAVELHKHGDPDELDKALVQAWVNNTDVYQCNIKWSTPLGRRVLAIFASVKYCLDVGLVRR